MKIFRAKRGFTLLEVMVVLCIIGITSSIAAPVYARMSPRLKLNAAKQELMSEFRQARNKALATQRIVNVHIDAELKQIDVDGKRTSVAANIRLMDERAVPSSELRFFPDGSVDRRNLDLQVEGVSAHLSTYWLTGRVVEADD